MKNIHCFLAYRLQIINVNPTVPRVKYEYLQVEKSCKVVVNRSDILAYERLGN